MNALGAVILIGVAMLLLGKGIFRSIAVILAVGAGFLFQDTFIGDWTRYAVRFVVNLVPDDYEGAAVIVAWIPTVLAIYVAWLVLKSIFGGDDDGQKGDDKGPRMGEMILALSLSVLFVVASTGPLGPLFTKGLDLIEQGVQIVKTTAAETAAETGAPHK